MRAGAVMRIVVNDKERSPRPAWIYFLRANSWVKIGWTRNLASRLRELQVASPFRLRVLGVLPGAFDVERMLHRRYHRFWIRGEWFHAASEIVDFARTSCLPLPQSERWESTRAATRTDLLIASLLEITDHACMQLALARGEDASRLKNAVASTIDRLSFMNQGASR